MHFYHCKIKESSAINHAVTGRFSGRRKPEIIISRGRVLELLSLDLPTGNIFSLLATDFNATIHSVELVRGVKKDYVAIGSDSGKVVILEFKLTRDFRGFRPVLEHRIENRFKVSNRFTPGMYLAVDSKSRALMIGAIEENIMFYNLSGSRDAFNLPLKVEQEKFITYDLVQVHNNSGPLFAALHCQYEGTKYKAKSGISEEKTASAPPTETTNENANNTECRSPADLHPSQPTSPLQCEGSLESMDIPESFSEPCPHSADPVEGFTEPGPSHSADPVEDSSEPGSSHSVDPVKVFGKHGPSHSADPVKDSSEPGLSHPADPVKDSSEPGLSHPADPMEVSSEPGLSHSTDPMEDSSEPGLSHSADPMKDSSEPDPSHSADPMKDSSEPDTSHSADSVEDSSEPGPSHSADSMKYSSEPGPSHSADSMKYSSEPGPSHSADSMKYSSEPGPSHSADSMKYSSEPGPSHSADPLEGFSKPGPSHSADPMEGFSKPGPSHSADPMEGFSKPGPSYSTSPVDFSKPGPSCSKSPMEHFSEPSSSLPKISEQVLLEGLRKLEISFRLKKQNLSSEHNKPGDSSQPESGECLAGESRQYFQSEISKEPHSKESKDANAALPNMILKFYACNFQSRSIKIFQSVVKQRANKLISVPPGRCHKGGVIACFCNQIEFIETETGQQAHCYFPQRRNLAFNNKKGMLISGSVTHKKGDKLLIFLQSEEGDLYSTKIVKVDEKFQIKMTYIDTVPTASAMCIVEGEYLFLGADYADHYLYRIDSLGSEKELKMHRNILPLFAARKLENLVFLSRLEGLSPVMNCVASDYTCSRQCASQFSDHACSGLLHLHFGCGRNTSSTLRTQRHGVEVQELFTEKFTPSTYPRSVWAIQEETDDGIISYIVVSLMDKTTVLSVDKEIRYVDLNSGFRCNASTMDCVQVGKDSAIQVSHNGFRYVQRRKVKMEWKVKCDCSQKKRKSSGKGVIQCAIYGNQIALALLCKEVVYIEVIESEDDNVEFKESRGTFVSGAYCMEFVPHTPKAELIAVCFGDSIHIYSVKSEPVFSVITQRQLLGTPASLVIINAVDGITYLNIGFEDGSIQRAFINESGQINSTFSFKLDSKRVELIKMKVDREDAILALSSRAWISFNCKSQFFLVPLLYEKLDGAAGFSSKLFPRANLIAVSDKQLVILSLKNFSSLVTENRLLLQLAPRLTVFNPKHKLLIVSEADYRPPYAKDGDMTPRMALDLAVDAEKRLNTPDITKATKLSEMVRNRPRSYYDSTLRIFDPHNKKTLFELTLPPNHIFGRVSLIQFDSQPDELYLLAAVKDTYWVFPQEKWHSYLYVYKVSEDGKCLLEIEKVKLENLPQGICAFQGHVLVSIGKKIWVCDFKEQLKMIAYVDMPCGITNIYARGDLFLALCENRGVIYGYWNKEDDKLVILHEDRYLQKVTTLGFWDDDIIIAGDRNGYLNVVLLPSIPPPSMKGKNFKLSLDFTLKSEKEEEKEPNLSSFRFMPNSYLIVKQYIGELTTSLQRTSFVKEGRDVMLYTTQSGTVGVLVPFLNKEPDIIFRPLQYLLEEKSHFHDIDLTGWPKRGESVYDACAKEQGVHIIDGNLCDLFNALLEEDRQSVANSLQKKPCEISEKLAEVKAKIFFNDCPSRTREVDRMD